MEAYRDQYATLFKNGRKVVVLGISVDPDTTLKAWAREADYPMLFATDPNGKIGEAYGAFNATNKFDNRMLYVVAPDGHISYKVLRFNVMAGDAYTDLGSAVDKVTPRAAG